MAACSGAFRQFVKFGIVGFSNTAISYVIYAILVFLGIHYLISSVIAFTLSVLWSFYWNNRMVFVPGEGESRSLWRSLVKTFAAYASTGLILANILLFVEVDIFSWNQYLAPLFNLVITVPLNFILNKKWAFRTRKS